jgi:hypothetical protein
MHDGYLPDISIMEDFNRKKSFGTGLGYDVRFPEFSHRHSIHQNESKSKIVDLIKNCPIGNI